MQPEPAPSVFHRLIESEFGPADRDLCTRLSRTGGSPTYTELLVCLEMARDARKLPKEKTLGAGR